MRSGFGVVFERAVVFPRRVPQGAVIVGGGDVVFVQAVVRAPRVAFDAPAAAEGVAVVDVPRPGRPYRRPHFQLLVQRPFVHFAFRADVALAAAVVNANVRAKAPEAVGRVAFLFAPRQPVARSGRLRREGGRSWRCASRVTKV